MAMSMVFAPHASGLVLLMPPDGSDRSRSRTAASRWRPIWRSRRSASIRKTCPPCSASLNLQVTRWGTVKIDWDTMMTPMEGVFAGGDIVRGASLVVWGVKDGRDAAVAIHDYLQTEVALPVEITPAVAAAS